MRIRLAQSREGTPLCTLGIPLSESRDLREPGSLKAIPATNRDEVAALKGVGPPERRG